MMNTDPNTLTPGSTLARRQSMLTIAGVVLVALAIAAGVWWGMQVANQQAQALPLQTASTSATSAISATSKTPDAAASANIVSNDKSMGKGETLITQPRYPRPPEVFDPIEALATQVGSSSAANSTSTALATAAKPAKPGGPAGAAANSAPAVQPVGWQGAGTALQQMWDLGAQAEWKVRPAALSRPNWRISGVVQRGEQTQAIVQIDGELTPRFFKIGDTLPGGAKLAWVKPNVIGVVMPKVGQLAVPVLDGQAPEQKTKVKKP